MAIPIVTQPLTPRTIAQGVPILPIQLEATEAPDSWTISALPQGLRFDDEELQILGTPTAAGLVSTSIVASNGDGASLAVQIVWNIQAQPVGAGLWSDLEVDFDLIERTVGIPGVQRQAGESLFSLGRDDRFSLLVGAKKFGVLRDLKPDAEEVSIRLALKEFEPELLLTSVGGEVTKTGFADTARFRVPVWIDPARWNAVLSDYEGDASTAVDAVAELEIAVGGPAYAETRSTSVSLQGGMTGEYGGNPIAQKTLTFTQLVNTELNEYELDVSLSVPGRPGQNVTLEKTLTLKKEGGVWVVSDLGGSDSVTGASEGGQWQVTLEVSAVDGHDGGVDVDVDLSTTDDGAGGGDMYAFDFDLSGFFSAAEWDLRGSDPFSFSRGPMLYLYNDGGELIGSRDVDEMGMSYFISPSAFFSEVKKSWDTLTSYPLPSDVDRIEALTETKLRVWVRSDAFVAGADIAAADEGVSTPPVISPGSPAAATLQGVMTQLTGSSQSRHTGQFRVRVMRDMVR